MCKIILLLLYYFHIHFLPLLSLLPFDTDLRCVKWIKAPPCHTPALTFHAFHLYGRNTYGDDQPLCYLDYLEIRNESLYSGEV